MILLPAIDLYEKRAVRLYKGDYQQLTDYGDPLLVARDFVEKGAEWIHMVDLEGARDGGTPNLDTVSAVIRESGLSVEIGGGIRDLQTAEQYLSAGAKRVILGTAAVTDEAFLCRAVAAFGEAVAVGADIRGGLVAIRGWRETVPLTLEDFADRMGEIGVSTMICTDISRDGAMRGSNLELYRALSEKSGMRLIASGGVSSMEELRELKSMGIYGAIIGKAYYTGAIDLAAAIREAI